MASRSHFLLSKDITDDVPGAPQKNGGNRRFIETTWSVLGFESMGSMGLNIIREIFLAMNIEGWTPILVPKMAETFRLRIYNKLPRYSYIYI